tara:strand:+ start:140 stop:589 length:450 start_codon:yes stop_codon:yes gene_type:complete
MSKILTEELIEQKLKEKYEYPEDPDQDVMLEILQDEYKFKLTDNWNGTPDYSIYAETTADGYEVWVATNGDGRNVCINEDVHYYESDLSDRLQDAMVDFCELIYVDDLEADYVEEAIMCAYQNLYEEKEEEITDELIEQGYEWPEKVKA